MKLPSLLLWSASLCGALAQQNPAEAPPPAPPTRANPTISVELPPSQSESPPPGGQTPPPQGRQKNELLGGLVPFFDPTTDTMQWNGHSWSMANQPGFESRFVKYLNAPPADGKEDAAYRATLRSILDALSPHQSGKGDIAKAVGSLPPAASYYDDARLCESIANAVYGVYLGRKNVAALRRANEELRKAMDVATWNARLSATPRPLENGPLNGQSNQGSRNRNANRGDNSEGGNTVIPDPANSLRQVREMGRDDTANQRASQGMEAGKYVRHYADYETQAATNKAAILLSEPQQKLEFQSLILQLFLQRRFEHVIISCRLYRELFQDGDGKIRLEDGSELQRLAKGFAGVSPTINMMDAFANEAIRDVDEGVRAFDHLLSKNEIESAAKRLAEAFSVGEYLPRVRTVPREKRERVSGFVQKSNQLISALEAKDYQGAQGLVDKLKAEAKDFDASKAETAIKTFVMTANLSLGQAMLAARNGDDKTLQEKLKEAHLLYPTNPELQRVSEQIFKGKDTQDQALNDLDRLVAQGNYRAIQKDEGRFAAAASLSNDPKRMAKLTELRDTIQQLRTSLEKAKALADSGAPEAAWETLRQADGKFRQDPDFSDLYAQLTVKAASFVNMIEQAERNHESGQVGASLAWYLKARQAHPKSVLAEKGIEKIVDPILGKSEAAQSQ